MKPRKIVRSILSQNSKHNQLTLLIASAGLLLLLVATFTLPFNQGLFSKLFTKPSSHADMMMSPQHIGCEFLSDPSATPAFCDTFQTPNPGGRGGDLDESIWDFARQTHINNSSQGLYNWAPVGLAQFCKAQVVGILPTHDSFFCGTQFNEANHWMEEFNDNGNYAYNDAMIRQPFDFTNRTGTITFEVDAKTDGGHTSWVQLEITDQPVPDPAQSGAEMNPRNGVLIIFENDCGYPGQQMSVEPVIVIQDYKEIKYFMQWNGLDTTNYQCITTAPDMANHFEVKLSQDSLQVWATDDDGSNFREIAAVDSGLGLNFTKGYVHFQHVAYNAEKEGSSNDVTYHWHNLGFDGPKEPIERGYSIPDALEAHTIPNSVGGMYGYNLGYDVASDGTHAGDSSTPVPAFTIPNVDLTDAIGATLTMDANFGSHATTLQYQFNGGTWHTFNLSADQTNGYYDPLPILIPIDLSDLKQGDNTLNLRVVPVSGDNDSTTLPIENIDLTVQTSDIASPPPATYMFSPLPSVAPFPPPQFNVTVTPSLTSMDEGQTQTLNINVTNTTQAPITGQLWVGVIGPNDILWSAQLVDNTTSMTFTPSMSMTHTVSYTEPVIDSTTPTGQALQGTYRVIVSILSPDQSAIYYTNPTTAYFSVPSGTVPSIPPTPTPTPSTTVISSPSPTPQPTASPSSCPSKVGDFNNDGVVNLTDLSIFSANFGTSSPNIPDPCTDMNSDGSVNLTDLSLFSAVFGT